MKNNKNIPYYKFKDQIEKLFDIKFDPYICLYNENFDEKTITMDLPADFILSFAKLEQLSKLLKTEKIDFNNYTEGYWYSEITNHSGDPTKIICYEVNFNNQ